MENETMKTIGKSFLKNHLYRATKTCLQTKYFQAYVIYVLSIIWPKMLNVSPRTLDTPISLQCMKHLYAALKEQKPP